MRQHVLVYAAPSDVDDQHLELHARGRAPGRCIVSPFLHEASAEARVDGRTVRLPRKLSKLSYFAAVRWLRGEPPAVVGGQAIDRAWARAIGSDGGPPCYERLKEHGLHVDAQRLIVTARGWSTETTEADLLRTIVTNLWELAYPRRGLGWPRRYRRRFRGNETSIIEETIGTLSYALGIPRSMLLGEAPSSFNETPGEVQAYHANVDRLQLRGLIGRAEARAFALYRWSPAPPRRAPGQPPRPRRADRGGLRRLVRRPAPPAAP